MELIDYILEGKCYQDQNHWNGVQKQFLSKIIDPSIGQLAVEGVLDQCKNELESVQTLKPFFDWSPIPEPYLTRFSKSTDLSSQLRERANEYYKSGNLAKALRGYNLAVNFAPSNSPELGLAFGNRSALFVQMKHSSLAIRDIDLALINNFPKQLEDKLIQRKIKCENVLANKELNGTNYGTPTDSTSNNANKNVKQFCEETYFKLVKPNAKIPNAESWVDISYQEDRGRRLIARRDVPAGTLILIDKPFVSVIDNLLLWDLQHCHFCSKQIQGGIPCQTCAFTTYCDDDCRSKSCHGDHRFEHGYLSYLQSLSIPHRDLQALRLLGRLGPEGLLKIFRTQSNSNLYSPSNSTHIGGFNEQNIYDCNSYLPIYHLISHGMNRPLSDKLTACFKALYLTNVLKQSSTFFTKLSINLSPDESIAFEDFITSLILRHVDNIRYNAISISELKNTRSGEISVTVAIAVYPLISLCNHSCDPNAVPVKKSKFMETALVALKNLKAGDEIFITYRPLFTTKKTKDRIEFLKNNYNFVCQCSACINDWSLKSIQPADGLEKTSMCGNCLSSSNDKALKVCSDCIRKDLKLIAELDLYEAELHKVDEMLKAREYVKAIQVLKPCLAFFSNNFSSVYSLSQVAADLFKRALVRLVNQAQEES